METVKKVSSLPCQTHSVPGSCNVELDPGCYEAVLVYLGFCMFNLQKIPRTKLCFRLLQFLIYRFHDTHCVVSICHFGVRMSVEPMVEPIETRGECGGALSSRFGDRRWDDLWGSMAPWVWAEQLTEVTSLGKYFFSTVNQGPILGMIS